MGAGRSSEDAAGEDSGQAGRGQMEHVPHPDKALLQGTAGLQGVSGARVSNLHMYAAVCADVIRRWVYPLTPEAAALRSSV